MIWVCFPVGRCRGAIDGKTAHSDGSDVADCELLAGLAIEASIGACLCFRCEDECAAGLENESASILIGNSLAISICACEFYLEVVSRSDMRMLLVCAFSAVEALLAELIRIAGRRFKGSTEEIVYPLDQEIANVFPKGFAKLRTC